MMSDSRSAWLIYWLTTRSITSYCFWNWVKIDAGLVWDLAESECVRNLVRGIIHLAHDLNMSAYAECVETAESASILKDLNCDKAQGWHFAKPMTANSLTTLLMRQVNAADELGTALHS